MSYSWRVLILGLIDAFIVMISITFAYFLRFEFQIVPEFFSLLPYVIGAHIILIFLSFKLAKIYRRVWEYASVGELVSLVKATTLSEILFYAVHMTIQFQTPNFVVPRSIYILSWVFITVGVGGSRLAWRMFRDSYLKIQPYHQRTLIIGAGKAGTLIAKELKHSTTSELYPVAFIDDNYDKWNLEINGLPVIGGRGHIKNAVEDLFIKNIIIAIPSASKAELSNLIDLCMDTQAKIKILPSVSGLVSNKISVSMIREVNVEDLLGREPIQLDLEGIEDYLSNQVILVTGAGGSIGSELCRQICSFLPKELLLLGHGENSIYDIELELRKSYPHVEIVTLIADIQDCALIKGLFEIYRPSVIFHAAAHKHVPLMEKNPAEAIKNNILGTKNVAECAHETGVSRFVLISTDKAVNPTSVMGASKRVSEMIVQGIAQESQTKFSAVRFGNVLDSRGSVIPLFRRQILEGGPITVTHPDMMRYFMTIPEAAQLVIQAGSFANGGEIFILDMGEPVKISDLAKDLISLSGLKPDEDIKIVYTGIRPGEKLFEEILTTEEGISATKHNRIFIGRPSDFSYKELDFMIRKLEQSINKRETNRRTDEIRELLKQIVPSYNFSSAQIKRKIQQSEIELAAGKEICDEV